MLEVGQNGDLWWRVHTIPFLGIILRRLRHSMDHNEEIQWFLWTTWIATFYHRWHEKPKITSLAASIAKKLRHIEIGLEKRIAGRILQSDTANK